MRCLANPNGGRSHFSIILGAHMNISFIILMKILVFIKWSYEFPLSSLYWFSCFEHIAQILLNMFFFIYVLGGTPNHIPLKYRCPIKRSNRIRRYTLMCIQIGWQFLKMCFFVRLVNLCFDMESY